jgi:hypothetical protein
MREFNTGVISISDWYIDPNLFDLEFYPLNVELKVKLEEQSPFPTIEFDTSPLLPSLRTTSFS